MLIGQAGATYHGAELLVALLQALQAAGLEKGANPEGYGSLDKTRVGVLVGSGMGGLTGGSRLEGQQVQVTQQGPQVVPALCTLSAACGLRQGCSLCLPAQLLQCSRTA